MLELTVPPEAAGHRLDRFLAGALAHLSRSRVQALIRERPRPAQPPPGEQARRGSSASADVVAWEEPPVVETVAGSRGARPFGFVRGRRPARHRQGCRDGHAPRARQRRGHAGQRAAGALPDAFGHRRRAAAGDRSPAGQGNERLPGGRQERSRPPRPRRAVRRPARWKNITSRWCAACRRRRQRHDRRAHRPPSRSTARRWPCPAAARPGRPHGLPRAPARSPDGARRRWSSAACTPGARTRFAFT